MLVRCPPAEAATGTQDSVRARTITEQLFKLRNVLRRRNDEDFPYAREHQRGQRVVDHGFVINRQQALANRMSHWIQASTRSARQNDALVL